MTENEAYHAVGLLIGGVKIWPEAATDAFVQTFVKRVDDAEAMIDVCERIALTWGDRSGHPTLREVLDEYQAHPRVAAEREASTAAALAKTVSGKHCKGDGWIDVVDPDGKTRERPCPRCKPGLAEIYADPDKWAKWRTGTPVKDLLDPDTAGLPSPPPCKIDTHHDPDYRVPKFFADGMVRGRDEYRSRYGREMGTAPTPNPAFAEQVIVDLDQFDPHREVWYAAFDDVAKASNGDYHRARVSVEALGRRVIRDMRGGLVLLLPVAPPAPPAAPPAPSSAAQPPPPSERPPDATGLLSEALGETRRRMEENR